MCIFIYNRLINHTDGIFDINEDIVAPMKSHFYIRYADDDTYIHMKKEKRTKIVFLRN